MSKPNSPVTRPKTPDALTRVRTIYRSFESRQQAGDWPRECVARTECCRFRLTGETPHLTLGEALVAAAAFRATGRKSLPPAVDDGSCPLLDRTSGRCLIYSDRPFACRTHFCNAAGGAVPRRDVIEEIRQLEAIDAELGGDGPRRIQPALDAALASHRNASARGRKSRRPLA